jgi:hypothetical protein
MTARPGYGFGFETAGQRRKRLAKQMPCGESWMNRTTDAGFWHICSCIKFRDHAGKKHECSCGATKTKAKR